MRKVRSDKKRDVKPTLSMYVKKSLYRFSDLIEKPVKDAGHQLIEKGLRHDLILREFQPLMIANFEMEKRLYFGNSENAPSKIKYRGETGKITIKFQNDVYDDLRRLAFSIGLTPTSTAAIMLRSTLYNYDFMNQFINYYVKGLEKAQFAQLEKFIRTIKNTIPK